MSEAIKPKAQQARGAVTGVLYHLVPGQPPLSVPMRVNRALRTDEQAWSRRFHVGDQWQRLETGWVERCSLLRIANEEGKGAPRALADEHRELLDAAAVEVGVSVGPGSDPVAVDVIPPGAEVLRMPPSLGCVWLRCRRGRAAVSVIALPE